MGMHHRRSTARSLLAPVNTSLSAAARGLVEVFPLHPRRTHTLAAGADELS
jgi:hypothetical protein